MIVIKDYNLIFIRLPKAAGTMATNAFDNNANVLKIDAGWGHHHQAAHELKREFPKDWKENKKFVIIRNPWELELDYFFYLSIRLDHERHNQHIIDGCRNVINNHQWRHNRIKDEHRCDSHRFPDSFSRFIFDDDTDELLVDDIIRFERLESDWRDFCKKNKINNKKIVEYPSKHRDKMVPHNHYSHYYTDDMIDIVADKHKDYIEYFGYKFEKEQ
tara:strand:+ start:397 stop:1044 length:648 start_codon:yes stop_codon:yes gene_type:complete